MTHVLILMRHAKSSWDDLSLDDHDRSLNARGRRSAAALGQWLKSQNLTPDEVISSSATRTQETFEGLGIEVDPTYTRALYLAGPEQMMDVLHRGHGKCVLMLGHNPGIAEFAGKLVKTRSPHDRFFDYPSGATTVMTFEADLWKNARYGAGKVEHFVIPRELPDY